MEGQEGEEELSVVSWNINGMRSLIMPNIIRNTFPFKPTIVAVQETKLTRSQLEEWQALVDGYSSYFTFSKNRAGYSGVATYCSNSLTPVKAEEGLSGTNLDLEYKGSSAAVGNYCHVGDMEYGDARFGDNDGRCVVTQHRVVEPDGTKRLLNVINVYVPRLRDDPSDPVNNRQFKLTFHKLLAERANKMIKSGQFVLIVGDFNVSHCFIDQSDIQDEKAFCKTVFREWLDDLLSVEDGMGFIDSFRTFHPNRTGSFTCWNTRLNCRETNYGARIDYIVTDPQLSKYIKDADVHQNIFGSDHCPISAKFHSLKLISNCTVPQFATKFYPEFAGKQQKLLDLFKKQGSVTNQGTPKAKTGVKLESRKKRSEEQGPKQTSLMDFLIKKPKLEESKTGSQEPRSLISMQLETSTACSTTNVEIISGEYQTSGFYEEINSQATQAWRQILKAPGTPSCTGHNESCVLRTVKKSGVNKGRQFWACPRGTGRPGDPSANCGFFKWGSDKS